MPGRKIRDERDALDCLQRLEHSGLELRDWAREHGVDGRSLHCWRMSLERGRKQESARLVELVAETAPAASAPPGKGGARYVIRTGVFELEVGDDFDQDTLFKLLEVVTSC